MFKISLFTYDSAGGLSLRRGCATMTPFEPKPPDRGVLPRLGALTSQLSEAALFLPWEEGMSSSPSLLSSEEGTLVSPETVCGLPPGWKPPLAPSLSSFSSSIGAWYGAGTSILVSTGLAESSGRGAKHLIHSAFFIQPWKKMVFSAPYHEMCIQAVFKNRVLTEVSGWLQSRPMSSVVSGHCFRVPKNNFHIPLCVVPKKCWRVCGPSGLNSHMRRSRRWHGKTRRTSIT